MRKLYIIFIGFLLPMSIFSQSWKSSNALMGDSDITEIKSTISSDGSIIILGHFNGTINTPLGDITTTGGRDYFIARFLSDGTLEWIKKLGSTANDYVLGGICACVNDNVYVTGGFKNVLYYSENDSLESKGSDDIFMAKYDIDGNIDWCRNIGSGAKAQRPNALKVDNNSNIILTGFFSDSIEFDSENTFYTNDGTSDFFIGKFDSDNGNPIWINHYKTLGGSSSGRFFDIGITDNFYAFAGTITDSIVIENDTIISNNHTIDMHCTILDVDGDFQWLRKIGGPKLEYSYAVTFDDEENIYLGGYYNSDTIQIDENNSNITQHTENKGDYDIIISKYNDTGDLQWYKTSGGKAKDKIFDIAYFNNNINVAGQFTDSLYWGGILLEAESDTDTDMLVGALDKNGNYRNANSYSGRNNSDDESRAIFQDGGELYTVMRTNTDLLTLGEDSYFSASGRYFIAMGVIGCNPISIDNTIYSDVTGCYGDSTGAIQISASGGFGSPWQYSIDNGLTYQEAPYFPELPAGDYQVVVIDKENCTIVGDVVTLTQPDSLMVELISAKDITVAEDGSIVVGAQGGTSPYIYTLMPNNILQGYGTFIFARGDSGRYVVQLNDVNLCGPVSTDTIWIQDLSSVGMNDLGGLMLRVFPNPATDVVTVEMPMEAAEVSMEVLSLTGQIVLSRRAYTTGGVLRETINVSELAEGMYMLRLNGKTLKSAFVVN